eukprot:TRINITY_DN18091_c0_g1_i1.p1 TRINITY_DN18091_c0_g1~~TRINITY_DN18091_c0_g1_i1.p1  ORF type:complete len:114 (-),score=25.15 TRINITY_DN18091_c0_g1_i1:33-374(-)
MEWPYFCGQRSLSEDFPNLDRNFKYGVVYYDGQMNDTRMNLDILLTATLPNYTPNHKPATVINHMTFTDFVKDKNGKIVGVKVKDKIDGKEYNVDTKIAVSYTHLTLPTIYSV